MADYLWKFLHFKNINKAVRKYEIHYLFKIYLNKKTLTVYILVRFE